MNGNRFTLLRVAGIPIQIDASWLVIAVALTWSLALNFTTLFPPAENPGWSASTYWGMAGVTAICLFGCLILHELGHALVGQRFGMRVRSITLFIFGGVAELENEPPSAKAEFWMAAAGPAVSVALSAGLALLAATGGPTPLVAVLNQLAVFNGLLVVFNLIPAFPLDGGRILRAVLWAVMRDLRRATTITATMGGGFATVLMVLGVVSILTGHVLPGLWWMMLGWFLQRAAQGSYEQVLVRGLLAGQPLRRFMTTNVSRVPPDLDVAQLVEKYFYRQHHQLYPVCQDGRLLGYVTPNEIKDIPHELWPRRRVSEIMATQFDLVRIAPDSDAAEALTQMQRTGRVRLLVVDGHSLVGILTLKDLLDFLSLKIELEGT
jgi:Zn-dependent protease